MKQLFGYLMIIIAIPLIFLTGKGMWQEINKTKSYEQKLEQAISLPTFTAQLPVVLKDQNGNIFSEEYVEWRKPLTYDEIPQVVKDIFVYSEDEQFFKHIGFNVSAIARAVVANSSANKTAQGGSTITQQLVRMRYLSEEKTYERKLMEIFYAYELEKIYEKQEIFEMYLNEMYFGYQVYGIGSAATFYFDKPIDQLTIAEIAFIAAIPNNPSLYDPFQHFDNTKERQERLIDTLIKHNLLSEEEAAVEKQRTITLNVKEKIQQYPTYSTYVLQELRWLVAQTEGFDIALINAKDEAERQRIKQQFELTLDELLSNGLVIQTALNPEKQQRDEQQLNDIMNNYPFEASATVIDNATREIVSIYGGKNYKKHNLHRAFQTPRQPGSTFKPLIDYAPAFELTDYTPNSTISGANYCIGNFCPENYGGYSYGNLSLSTAFSNSVNTSALRLLATVGVDNAFSYLNRFHFRSLVPEDQNYAAALGGLSYGVTSLELSDAYTSFIDGSYLQAHAIRSVKDLSGNELYSWSNEREVIWSQKTVRYMRELLNDATIKGTARGIRANSTYIGAKTGTTNQIKDLWIAGLTNEHTIAVWTGFDEGQSMENFEDTKVHFMLFNTLANE